MKNEKVIPSEFFNHKGIEYFLFEEDFMEQNIRCIPMIVRFKMDRAGIKLKLSEWNKFSTWERIQLAEMDCYNDDEAGHYNHYLAGLVRKYTYREAMALEIDQDPLWENMHSIPGILTEKLDEFGWTISIEKWRGLTNLQRFALLKLCRPKHENKNFPKAMKEFSLLHS
jgi:hypothetical protein